MNFEKLWLASYPRSGNTFLRSIFYDCFGIVTGSAYYEENGDAGLLNLLGRGRDRENDVDNRFSKTHDYPADDHPAIYIVRHGAASIVSYRHYMKNFAGADIPLSDIISGNIMFGSWSDHYNTWQPATRRQTLLVRYEDLVSSNQASVIESIGDFIGIRPKNFFTKDFKKLQSIHDKFFRSGNNQNNISEFSDDDLKLFNAKHGKLMLELGYE